MYIARCWYGQVAGTPVSKESVQEERENVITIVAGQKNGATRFTALVSSFPPVVPVLRQPCANSEWPIDG